ncbi:MAG: DEAD/DEAH box helicase [Pseudomonadota bacterium]
MDFQGFSFHPSVMAGVAAAGYATPTPIQKQAIGPVMQGADVMGLAQTGTGQTAAFALPILHRLMTGPRQRIRALVMAPTRELAEQIRRDMDSLGKNTRLKSVSVYGGVGISPQAVKLKRHAEIVVACPGRLLDHIGRGNVDLSALEVLVIDEADQMFDMGFFPDIRRILSHLPKKRQTLMFSATMPTEIRHLAKDVLTDPVMVQVGIAAPAETVRHAIYPVTQGRKTQLLLEMLQASDTGSVLVFTRTKHRAKRLGEQLSRAGHACSSIQGNLSQGKRQAALDGFRAGTYRILVATDIAARGIDVSGVSHVINYDMPSTPDAYIHRIGRTGRATLTGDAYTMVTGDDREMVKAITRILGRPIERRTIKGFDYEAKGVRESEEFARPPRQERPRSNGAGKGGGGRTGTSAPFSPKPYSGGGRRQSSGRPGGASRAR